LPSQRYTTRVRLCVAVVENRPETTLIAPPGLADAFAAGRALMDRQSATPTQNILAEFIGEGHFATHLRKMRVLYAERRDALIRALELHCTDALDWGEQSPEAGLHLVGKLRSAAKPESDMDVWEAAMRVGFTQSTTPGCNQPGQFMRRRKTRASFHHSDPGEQSLESYVPSGRHPLALEP
jgi:DNA-binding transcriptional MocR family regulator